MGLFPTACGGGSGGGGDAGAALPRLAEATGATLASCSSLASGFAFANTRITSSEAVAAGALTGGGTPIAAHCLVKGEMFRRTS